MASPSQKHVTKLKLSSKPCIKEGNKGDQRHEKLPRTASRFFCLAVYRNHESCKKANELFIISHNANYRRAPLG